VNTVTNWGTLADAITAVSFGASGYIAGGGGGGYGAEPSGGAGSFGAGGTGGGGRGGNNSSTNGVAGTANTGGGGGGQGFDGGGYSMAGNGGSGICVLRVPVAYTASATTGSPVVGTDATYRYYKFTGNGSITF
jgi:hypothetical protein